jgi:hypothetical protein
MGGLSQSDKIFGALLIAFIIYITVRGQLSAPNGYLGIFQHASSSSSGNPITSLINGVASLIGGSNIQLPGGASVQIGGTSGQGATTTTPDGSIFIPALTP